jgi:hypothetical protein
VNSQVHLPRLTNDRIYESTARTFIHSSEICESGRSTLVKPPVPEAISSPQGRLSEGKTRVSLHVWNTYHSEPMYRGYPDTPIIRVYRGPSLLLTFPPKIPDTIMNAVDTRLILSTTSMFEGWLPPAPKPTTKEFIPGTRIITMKRIRAWIAGLKRVRNIHPCQVIDLRD